MTEFKQIITIPEQVASALNGLQEYHDICFVIPCHEYDGTLVVIVYKEKEATQ